VSHIFLLLVLVIPVVPIAPVPPLSEKELIAKYWGKVYIPSDKYVFKPSKDGKALTIRTAGEPAIEGFLDRRSTIPRAYRTVTGDFEATVKLVEASMPGRDAKCEMGQREVRAGLRVSGGFSHAEIELYQYRTKLNDELRGQPNRVIWFKVSSGSKGEGNHITNAAPSSPVFLRITRKGKDITVALSFDGKKWRGLPVPVEYRPLKLPDEVTVGIYLSHTTHQIAEATFTDLKIEKLASK
jgi:hypothetical protein